MSNLCLPGFLKLGTMGGFKKFFSLLFLFLLAFQLINSADLNAQTNNAKILGKVVDSESGEAVIGANIYLEGISIGAGTDLDGTFLISNVPAGDYTLIVQMISYATLKLTDFTISAGETKRLELTLKPEALTTEEVVVEAKMLRNNEASLLRERQKSVAVSDAISAEAISRSGSGNAAEAMTQVTGASVVDGKYVYIRGLGERYSSTMLNGAELPSADPEKKSVQMDLFPSNLLDNIVTLKTFTPDKPGNFSGGMVDIGTKSYPEKFTLKLSTGTGYNSLATFNSDYLSYAGGSQDWLGMDDGTRAIPDILKSNPEIPTRSAAERDPILAQELDQFSKAFKPQMAPLSKQAPINQSYALSVGNQTMLFGRQFGYLGSFSYKRDYSYYDGGRSERWQLGTDVATTDSLNPKILLSDSKGTDEVNWGGLATFNYKFNPNHALNANVFYTQSGESSARYLAGPWPEQFGIGSNAIFETRVLKYTERNLQSYQLGGDHYFEGLLGMKMDWKGAWTNTTQDEPDTRYFSDHYSVRPYQGRDTTLYSIAPSNYSQPARYFRNLDETGRNFNLNLALPFKQWNGFSGKIKFGGSYIDKDRTFEESRYQYVRPATFRYDGDPVEFFSNQNTGIIGYDSTRSTYVFGNYIELSPDPRGGNYSGTEKISASYGMIELPLMRDLRFIGGVRFETTRMDVSSADTTKPEELRTGKLNNDDWLPSVNLVYQLGQNMNFRTAYGRTLARPTLREKAPYVNFEFVNDYSFAGNVNLQRTLIDNYDVRWEWFERPGEILAVSGFYKVFHQPIERTIIGASSADNPEVTYQNVDRGTVFGVEFEIRKQMDQLYSGLRNFGIGMNLTLVHSQVDIPTEKLEKLRERDPNREYFKDDTRPLQGQSPYLFNIDFGYDNFKSGTAADISYNVFGKRLAEVTGDATPDVYEKSRGMLNFNLFQKVFDGLKFKFAAKNILDSSIKFVHEYKGVEYIRKEYKLGRTFSVGLDYDLF